MTDPTAIEPFTLAIDDTELDDLRSRLAAERLPERETAPTSEPWQQGVPLAYLEDLVRYWRTEYSWRRVERELNERGQFRTVIDGLGVHFLHVRSTRPDARPLLLTHGWPGSVVEFLDVIAELSDPVDPAAPAFHVVVPSLPGFGFSDRPVAAGWGVDRIVDAWAVLMTRLDYPRFLAHGGDWGGPVTCGLAVRHPDRIMAIHTTFPQISPSDADPSMSLDARETAMVARTERFRKTRTAYARVQGTSPQTIGYALVDSPVALLAWIIEKFAEWTDSTTGPEEAIARDRLLDNVMLYWLTATGASAARLYWESYARAADSTPITVPAGFSIFPGDIAQVPRPWLDSRYRHIVHYRAMPRGGHFAALEVPDLLVAELRETFGSGLETDPPRGAD